MGQYYHPIILNAEGRIVVWMDAQMYGNGNKLTEHGLLKNNFTCTFEYGLSPGGIYHMSRVVWAGDYANDELEHAKTLYTMCSEYNRIAPAEKKTEIYRYVVNHSKRQFVDKSKVPVSADGYALHPLPLLTAEGNGRGGGDYYGKSQALVGAWARDIISVEDTAPAGFAEIVFNLVE